MVDSFCTRFWASMDYREAIEEWNVIQVGPYRTCSHRTCGGEQVPLEYYTSEYSTTARQHDSTTARQHYSATALQHDSTTALQRYSTTVLQHYSTSALHHYSATALHLGVQYYSTTALQYHGTAAHYYSTTVLHLLEKSAFVHLTETCSVACWGG